MELEDQVCLLDQAKKLKELGVAQLTLFTWKVNNVQSVVTTTPMAYWIDKYAPQIGNTYYAAFTVAELSIMLLEYAETYFTEGGKWRIGDADFDFDTQAEASAGRLIYLIENDILTVEEINNRLTKNP